MALLGRTTAARIFFGRVESSHKAEDRTWRRWLDHMRLLGIADDPRSIRHRSQVVCIFMQRLRDGAFCRGTAKDLRTGTLEKALGNLVAKFGNHDRPSPCHVPGSNHYHPLIDSLKKAWRHLDPEEKRQKAATPRHLRHMLIELTKCDKNGRNPKDMSSFRACNAELACAAYFTACRSCEYSTVKQRGKTKLLTIGNIIFKCNDEMRSPIEPTHPDFLSRAFFVCITFVAQKNGEKYQTRTQSRTNDPLLCPVRLWGRIIRRILLYRPDAPADTPVNCWFDPAVAAKGKTPKPRFIRAEDTIEILRETCDSGGGTARFGYRPLDIGTHSL